MPTVDEFLKSALYGISGFYSSCGFAGPRGHFITSPSVGPLFGRLLASRIDHVWAGLGRPSNFMFIDVGAGQGDLVRSVVAANPRFFDGENILAVETSSLQREKHPFGITSLSDFPDSPICGVVFANELLDNLPFRLFQYEGKWYEVEVQLSDAGNYREELVECSWTPIDLPSNVPNGTRLPMQVEARDLIREVLSKLTRGHLIVIDYGHLSTTDIVAMDQSQWLRTYRNHGMGASYLDEVGKQDITCDVMFDQVFAGVNVTYRTQADFLMECGIEALVAEGRAYWESHASRPDVTAMAMRSRVSEAEALLDPAGLGGFTVAEVVVS